MVLIFIYCIFSLFCALSTFFEPATRIHRRHGSLSHCRIEFCAFSKSYFTPIVKNIKKNLFTGYFFFLLCTLYSLTRPTARCLLARYTQSEIFFCIKSELIYSMFSRNKRSIHIYINTCGRVESSILFILYSHKIILNAATVEFPSSSNYIIITLNDKNTYRLQCNTTIQ